MNIPPDQQTSQPEDFTGHPGANSFVCIKLDGAIETLRYDAFVDVNRINCVGIHKTA